MTLAITNSRPPDPRELPAPSGLMCSLLAMPERTAIVDVSPSFSWIVNSNENGDLQRAYELEVADKASGLVIWNSSKVTSDQSVAVAYAGPPLSRRTGYSWRVRTWNARGLMSAWSPAQGFTTGGERVAGADRYTTARYPVVQTAVTPVHVVWLGAGHVLLDFGRDAFAGLDITLDLPVPSTISIHLGEALTASGCIDRKPGGSIRCQAADVSFGAGKQTVRVPLTPNDGRLMSDGIGPVMPFRYVEIENLPSESAFVSSVQLVAHYPFDDRAAEFSSSNAELNAVWELCRYTMKATSFGGVFVDGDRERLPYEADAYINQLGYYYCDREFTLSRYSHEYLIQHPTWPTEWILHSVLIAWTDYLYTGDSKSIACFYDDLKAKSLIALARPDGLIASSAATPENLKAIYRDRIEDIVDWPIVERDGYDFRPVNTVVNAFYYRALLLMAKIADALGNGEDAMNFREQAARVFDAFNAALFDPGTGLYVDGEGACHSSLHANMCAAAFELVPDARMQSVAAFIRGKGMACSVYGAQYLLEACYAANMDGYALDLLTARDERSWMNMIDGLGATMTTEAWSGNVKPNQDWNHAWGAAPANIIPRFVMGIEPVEPGYRSVRIRPRVTGLTSASIKTPTIRGAIRAEFVASTDHVTLTVELPANMTAEIWLPAGGASHARLVVDGAVVQGVRDGRYVVAYGIGSGKHALERRIASPS
ncbi:MAG: family 78 glycoside hydrolase catalytic domain [Capsulimonadaceae bacterium]|nr:family 78 glycoside hydrolase catalytic domain [Capsulimonadaceae bacterium]